MAKGLGQPIVIDNRPGAGVIVGTNAVAKADPDGYTLLITTLAHPINITLQKKLPYDSIADFEPVALMGIINFILVVHPSLADHRSAVSRRLSEGEPRQGELRLGRHREPDASRAGAVQVADRRAGQSCPLSRRGRRAQRHARRPVDFHAVRHADLAPHIQSGGVRALATPSPKRSSLAPQVPTTAEAGMEKWQTYSCIMMLAPKGTPRPVVDRLNREANAAMASDEVKERLSKLGIDAVESSTPESTAKFIRDEAEKWAPIVKATGAQVE